MSTEEAELKETLATALLHIRYAVKLAHDEAGEGGQVRLSILAVKKEGQGRILSIFETSFLDAVAKLIGMGDLTDEQEALAETERFLAQFKSQGDKPGG